MALPSTRERVPENTAEEVNRRIEQQTIADVQRAVAQGRIAQRVSELDKEWDIERAIEMNASALAFIGIVLGFFVHPYWLLLPALVTAFLFQHALQGWCPPVPVLRRMGFRTAHEIELERQALKAIRGDYAAVSGSDDRVSVAMAAAERR